MNIFYCPKASVNQYSILDETESRHVTTVLRKKVGDELNVFDGIGNLFSASIESVGKKEINLRITDLLKTELPPTPSLHIAIAPPKNVERLEWFIEKVTEIGVNEITPLLCQHSERKELRTDRIEKILLGACKQSLKLNLPKLNGMMKLEDFLQQKMENTQKLIAYCDEKSLHMKDACKKNLDTIILIGPEGDFTKQEVASALQNGFQAVSLGKSRLRLETAGIFAATVFNLINE